MSVKLTRVSTSRRPDGRRVRLLIGAAIATSLLMGCQSIGGEDEGSEGTDGETGGGGTQQLSIATGGTGGVYYPLGGGIATLIREEIPDHDATVQETNGSVDNMLLIQEGTADLALALGDTVADAVEGAGEFEGNPVDACALGHAYDNYTHLVTSTDSGITSVEDLRGKVVSLGSPGSGTETIGLRVLEAAGMDGDADIQRQQLGVDETAAGLRDGTIDAGFWSGGLPTGALVEYATSGGMALVPLGDQLEAMQEAYGEYYAEAVIPADTYEGQTEEVVTNLVPNVLIVSSDMSEDLQRDLTAVIFDNKERLVEVHPAAEELDAETADEVDFVDVCPGAQSYFDEQS